MQASPRVLHAPADVLGEAHPRHVHQVELRPAVCAVAVAPVVVERARVAGGLGGAGELLAVEHHVDQRRLAHIGSTHKHHLRYGSFGSGEVSHGGTALLEVDARHDCLHDGLIGVVVGRQVGLGHHVQHGEHTTHHTTSTTALPDECVENVECRRCVASADSGEHLIQHGYCVLDRPSLEHGDGDLRQDQVSTLDPRLTQNTHQLPCHRHTIDRLAPIQLQLPFILLVYVWRMDLLLRACGPGESDGDVAGHQGTQHGGSGGAVGRQPLSVESVGQVHTASPDEETDYPGVDPLECDPRRFEELFLVVISIVLILCSRCLPAVVHVLPGGVGESSLAVEVLQYVRQDGGAQQIQTLGVIRPLHLLDLLLPVGWHEPRRLHALRPALILCPCPFSPVLIHVPVIRDSTYQPV
mmetsp:Transcript_243/g.783  ORF Transcript_243/g.783 Transcript_243/m.783 type:complete len:411 (-) Transcript_243:333-1565(-)